MEKSRLKKDSGEEKKAKWSVLFVNSTGKVFTLSYIKAAIVSLIIFISAAMITIAVLASIIFVSVNQTKDLKSRIDKLGKENAKIKKENENIRFKLALLTSDSDTGVKDKSSKEEKAQNFSSEKDAQNKSESVRNKNRANKEESEKNYDGRGLVELREYKITRNENNVVVNFDIVNMLEQDKILSGYIFTVLKNENLAQSQWVISPYSGIVNGKPATPSQGQYFSIARFKPVTIKFPGKLDLKKFNRAEVFVYLESSELILKKGFNIDEK